MATPVETVIQQILDDNLGPGAPQLYCPVSPGFMVTEYIPEYVSVWDALQTLVAQFGGWIGYKWIPDANDFRLTLLIPPRSKDAASADWAFDRRQIIVQHLDISDRDIRNAVLVTYRDINSGKRETTGAFDSASILEFGRRAMQIEEADTSLIDTQVEAMALADRVLHDLKDITATTRLILPFLPTLDVFDGILVTNPRLSSTQDFYAVESVEHVLDFDRGQFRTEAVASGRVIGGRARWLLMETRPGSPGKPIDQPPPFTVIVAAADSPLEEREKAQYFCDGVDDQEQINAAIQSLGAAGGTVQLLKGTYYVSDSVLLQSYVTLAGRGTGTVLRLTAGNRAVVQNASSGAARIAVRDLTIDANRGACPSSYGLRLVGVSESTIVGVQCLQASLSGLRLDNCIGVVVSACICTDSNYGIYVVGGSACSITACVARNNGWGITLDGASGVAVANCTCDSNSVYGIDLVSATNCSVSGNTCRRNGGDGIRLAGASDNNVTGNTCAENAQVYTGHCNIMLTSASARNTVQGNLCRAGTLTQKPAWGIRVEDGSSNLITSNDCYSGGTSGGISYLPESTNFGAGNRNGDGTWSTTPN